MKGRGPNQKSRLPKTNLDSTNDSLAHLCGFHFPYLQVLVTVRSSLHFHYYVPHRQECEVSRVFVGISLSFKLFLLTCVFLNLLRMSRHPGMILSSSQMPLEKENLILTYHKWNNLKWLQILRFPGFISPCCTLKQERYS